MLYKRATALIGDWSGGVLHLRNFERGTAVAVQDGTVSVLNALSDWCSADELARRCPDLSIDQVAQLLDQLHAAEIVVRPSSPPSLLDRGLAGWRTWGLSAALFHFESKRSRYHGPGPSTSEIALQHQLAPPPPRPDTPGEVALPRFDLPGEFAEVLLKRRSWRRFGERPLTLKQLSVLVGLTFANQQWIHVGAGLALPLKTSPSGGACHSYNVWVLARSVDGLTPGLYRYSPEHHTFAQMGGDWTTDEIGSRFGGQGWVAGAGAIVILSSVFERVQWKYQTPHAYRVVLLEGGHLCQSFCLVAARLRLAPFCTAALDHEAIERTFGVDGVTESVIYAMGVGTRPHRSRWEPTWDGHGIPKQTLPAHRRRTGGRKGSRS